ncbi:MAG: ATP-binding protein [Sulfitobacter sp.]|nr:ATP-binding protein [Sulfitobacter sp.]
MPVRLALVLIALFAVVSLVSLAATYAVTQNSFEQTIRANLRQDLAGFRAAPNSRAVALLVEAESREADPNRLILSYISPTGRIYGNGAVARDDEGFHIFSLDRDRAQYQGAYLSLTATLYGGLITVARSRAEINALGAVFVNILLLSLLPTMLIALGGGLVLARRSKRHVEVVSRALDRMTSGGLAARVAVGPRWSDDLREIGGRLNQMASAQETSTQALRQVSSDIAHDLKTPLQRVALILDDLERHVDQEGAADLIAKGQEEVRGMGQTFQALLQLAQVEAGSPRERFAPVDLSALAWTLFEMFEPSATAQGHSLRARIAPDVTVRGDRALLGQMLSNLLENAARHSPPGSEIELHLDKDGQGVRLAVLDDGPGIPAAERGNVVKRLYRLDRSRHTPGNGLGLSLVEAIVTLHGAQLVLADNDPGLRAEVLFQRSLAKDSPL